MFLFTFIILVLLCIARCRLYRNSNHIQLAQFDVSVSTSLKGIMAIAIVLHHVEAHIFIGKYTFFSQLANWGLWIVSLFFFITGYGLQYSIEHKGNKYLIGFLQKRVLKIFLPLFLATTIYVLFCYLKNNTIQIGGGNPPLPNSWFAYTIILYYCAFFFVQKKTSNQLLAQCLMGFFTILYVIIMAKVLQFPPFWYMTCYGINLGMLAMHFEDHLKEFIVKHTNISILLALMLCAFYCLAEYLKFPAQSLFWGMGIPFQVLLIVYLGAFNGGRICRMIGKYSYEIYLVHGALFGLYYYFPVHDTKADCLFVTCLILLTFILSVLLHRFVNLLLNINICSRK